MQETDPKFPAHKRLAIPCDCAGACTLLVIERWDRDEEWPDEFYANLYTRPVKPTMRFRLRYAWRSLAGQATHQPEMVIGASQARELRDWLTERLNAT